MLQVQYVQQDVGFYQCQHARECPLLQNLPRPKVWTKRLWLRRRCGGSEHGHRFSLGKEVKRSFRVSN
ncbi:hypothetical protein SK128_007489 [Halocaridina rubra]|uniref:Uncharacterized protein n=1 Tax=Halocaridina rubra TaxID=373956 RepID=A0AAN9A804_HALRR